MTEQPRAVLCTMPDDQNHRMWWQIRQYHISIHLENADCVEPVDFMELFLNAEFTPQKWPTQLEVKTPVGEEQPTGSKPVPNSDS